MVLGIKCGESRWSRDMKRYLKLSCIPYGFDAQILWMPLSALHCVFFSGSFSGPIVGVQNCWFSDKQEGSGGKTGELVCLWVRRPPKHAFFVKCSEGDVRRMRYPYGDSALQTWAGSGKVTRGEHGAMLLDSWMCSCGVSAG